MKIYPQYSLGYDPSTNKYLVYLENSPREEDWAVLAEFSGKDSKKQAENYLIRKVMRKNRHKKDSPE